VAALLDTRGAPPLPVAGAGRGRMMVGSVVAGRVVVVPVVMGMRRAVVVHAEAQLHQPARHEEGDEESQRDCTSETGHVERSVLPARRAVKPTTRWCGGAQTRGGYRTRSPLTVSPPC